jgi:hypothetical protein
MHFASEGLILGAGTVVVAAEGSRRLRPLQGQEARVLTLLSAAYGKAVAPSVLANIERAAKAWREGDDCLAYIHLAHARLPTLREPYDAARRLFIVDGFMKAGTSPRAVFEAFHFGAAYIDAVEKFFNPDEPRVPAGSGRTSGEWTDSEETGGDDAARAGTAGQAAQGSSLLGRTPPRQPAFWGKSAQRRRLSSARMLCVFSVRLARLRQHSGCCSSRLLTISVSKARCPKYRGCAIPGIATKLSFI